MKQYILYLLLTLGWYKVSAQVVQKKFYQTKAFKTITVPIVFIGYGILSIDEHGLPSSYDVKNWRDKHASTFNTSVDDYMVFIPAAAVYGLDLLNTKSKSDPLNQTIIFAKTSALTLALVYGLKYITKETRPDGSNDNSFPSAHTAVAFAYATVLHEEFKDKSVWISIAGYSAATATGAFRILNNKHWYSDVLVGAGLGILSTKLVYLTHQYKYKWDWQKNSSILPIIGNQQYGLLWQKKF